MTFQEMRDEIQKTLGLQGITDYNELELVDRWLNRGVQDVLARTRCVVRCVHLQTSAGVGTYTLDHAIMALVDVEDGVHHKRRRSETLAGRGYTLIRADLLQIPAPEEDGELDVWAVLRPHKMTDTDHSPGDENYGAIPDEYQDAILLYALWRGSDYADDQSGGQGERYRNLYEGPDGRGGRLSEIRRLVNKRGTAFAPRRRSSLRPVSSRRAWVG